jgi:lipopolysaccharide/colanic/teichoic acid biosynthesis glycosyltransferase
MATIDPSIEAVEDHRLTIIRPSLAAADFSKASTLNGKNGFPLRFVPSHVPFFVTLDDPQFYAVFKRGFDIVGSLLLLMLTSPIWMIAALLVRATSPGPVLFRQTRIGKGGLPFTCYKFRSMVDDAEHRKLTLLHLNEVGGPMFKMRDDPRVTRVGKWFRKLSVDELPQLVNVLRGEMSLVGPRPSLPQEVDQFSYEQRLRFAVQPGITGLWQVSGRSQLSFEQWMKLDLEYIEHRSMLFDAKILLRTIPAVVLVRGAF